MDDLNSEIIIKLTFPFVNWPIERQTKGQSLKWGKYTFKINERWRTGFKITPRLASTLTEKITGDDLFLNGGVFFVNDRTKATTIKRPY